MSAPLWNTRCEQSGQPMRIYSSSCYTDLLDSECNDIWLHKDFAELSYQLGRPVSTHDLHTQKWFSFPKILHAEPRWQNVLDWLQTCPWCDNTADININGHNRYLPSKDPSVLTIEVDVRFQSNRTRECNILRRSHSIFGAAIHVVHSLSGSAEHLTSETFLCFLSDVWRGTGSGTNEQEERPGYGTELESQELLVVRMMSDEVGFSCSSSLGWCLAYGVHGVAEGKRHTHSILLH